MGCKHSKPPPDSKFISSLRTISLNAEDMLARDIQKNNIEKKKKRALTKLKLMYHLNQVKNEKNRLV
jgi:hypothetical protein